MISRLAALAALVVLAGCMPMHKRQPPDTLYQLRPPSIGLMAQPPALPAGTVVELTLPSVPAGMDKDRIALGLDQGRRLDYYTGARWPAPLPDVLQDAISQTLLTSLPGLGVDDEDHVSAPTHRLRVDVLNFAPIYMADARSNPQVQGSFRFVLTRAGDGKALADFTLSAQEQPQANTLSSVTAALETSLHRVMHDALPRLAGALAAKKK